MSFRQNKGFTLIEMAVVMVIIGLIFGVAMKGRDLIQGAKQKEFYTNYVKSWRFAVFNYYDQTGMVLSDGIENGGTSAEPDGRFDNVSGAHFGNVNGVDNALRKAGLPIPESNTASSGQYTFQGKYSGPKVITLNLYYLTSHTDGTNHNCLYFTNLPTDLAIAIDKMHDGAIEANKGHFRRYPDNADGDNWPDASTTVVVNAMLKMDIP